MPTNEDEELWLRLEMDHGGPVPAVAKRLLSDRALGLLGLYQAGTEAQRETAFERMRAILRSLRQNGLLRPPETVLRESSGYLPSGGRDDRWDLWRDLRKAAGCDDEWAAITVSHVYDASGSPALGLRMVEISVDHRMSEQDLVKYIHTIWSRLKEEGWVRPTRRPQARAIAYIRHVCLETPPEAKWRERLRLWNEKYPHWRHQDVRAFQAQFFRAETQLTGEYRGLRWFYDPDFKTIAKLTHDAEVALWERTDPEARRLQKKLLEGEERSRAESMRLAMARLHGYLAAGLTPEQILTKGVPPDWLAEVQELEEEVQRNEHGEGKE